MTKATTVVVCVATQESGGDSTDDYVQLANTFTQAAAADYTPKRVVAGTPQVLAVTGGGNGFQITWMLATNCTGADGAMSAFGQARAQTSRIR